MMHKCFAPILAVVSCSIALAQQTDSKTNDEAAIRSSIASYVDAYNRGDADAVAEYWSDTGEWVSPNGDRVVGRAAIADAMRKEFKESTGIKVEVIDPKIHFVTSEVAIEEGRVRVTAPGEATVESTYVAVQVKRDGAWKLDAVRETEMKDASTPSGPLAELAWMVGQWSDGDAESSAETSVKWTKNNTFLTSDFRVSAPGMDDLEGTQLIGSDPGAGVIRSWMFDYDGGFGEGVWTRDGNRWTVDFAQVLPDGRKASCSNIYTLIDADHYTWQSVNRQVDGEPLPDVDEVIVARKDAPSPAIAKKGE